MFRHIFAPKQKYNFNYDCAISTSSAIFGSWLKWNRAGSKVGYNSPPNTHHRYGWTCRLKNRRRLKLEYHCALNVSKRDILHKTILSNPPNKLNMSYTKVTHVCLFFESYTGCFLRLYILRTTRFELTLQGFLSF